MKLSTTIIGVNDQIICVFNDYLYEPRILIKIEERFWGTWDIVDTVNEDSINREIYLTLLKNYEQLKIVRAGQIGYARIIDLPINTFKAIAPKKLLIWVNHPLLKFRPDSVK